MIPRLAASLLLAIAMGLVLTSEVVLTGAKERRHSLVLAGSLAVGFGIGIAACAFFLWAVLLGPDHRGLALVELALLVGLIAVRLYTWRAQHWDRWSPRVGSGAPSPSWVFRAGLSASLVVSASLFMVTALRGPYGGWDAWMTWNVMARFLFRGGDHWQDAFSSSFRHPDYPLLLPGIVARSWEYVGSDTVVAPVTVAMLFTFATIALAGSSLALLRTTRQAVLAVLILLGTQFLITHGASQYADVPLAFFMLATTVLVFLHDRASGRTQGLVALAGTAAAFAAWTKNEGLLFLASVIVARCAVLWKQRRWHGAVDDLRGFALGLAPVLAILAYFKLALAPSNDFVSGQSSSGTLVRLLDFQRYVEVARVFTREVRQLADNGLVSAVPLLFAYLLCVGVKVDAVDRRAVGTSLVTLALVLSGYVLVGLTAPDDYIRLLNSSVDRLLLQLWPTAVFTYFMIARPPEEATG